MFKPSVNNCDVSLNPLPKRPRYGRCVRTLTGGSGCLRLTAALLGVRRLRGHHRERDDERNGEGAHESGYRTKT